MRLAVSGNGYTSATNAFLDAHHLATSTAHRLLEALDRSGAMAGHTAAGFAASYDDAARDGVLALVDLADALANLGRMSEATGRNHEYAEARAAIRPAPLEAAAAPSHARPTLRLPPSAAGTHGAEVPPWAAWLLDHIEGFIWPDSDIDRVRATARAWRAASAELERVKAHCLDAAVSFSVEVAPDAELAADASRRFATRVDSLAQTFHGIARSCDDLADQVHHHREQVLAIVRETLREAVIVEGIGLVLGAVTGGVTAAAATAVNGARIAAVAPRILRMLEALRIAIGTSQTGARFAAAAVAETRAGFQAYLKARVIVSDRGAAMPFYWYEATKDGTRLLKRAPGWLLVNERPGHVLKFHVGKTDAWLLERIARHGLEYSSSFVDMPTAERAIEAALHGNAARIETWLASGTKDKLEIDYAVGEIVGRTCDRDGVCIAKKTLRVVLRPDATMPHGYYVRTAFPQ